MDWNEILQIWIGFGAGFVAGVLVGISREDAEEIK